MSDDKIYKSIVRVAFCKALDAKGGQEYKILQELCNTVYTLLPHEAALWEALADDVLNDPKRYKPEKIETDDQDDDDDASPVDLPETEDLETSGEDPETILDEDDEDEKPRRRRKVTE